MSSDLVRRSSGIGNASVDDLEGAVVRYGAKDGLMDGVVGNVIDDGCVVCECGFWGEDVVGFCVGSCVPGAVRTRLSQQLRGGLPEFDGGILRTGQNKAFSMRIPCQSISIELSIRNLTD